MKQFVLGIVRHVMTYGGGFFTAEGLATSDEITAMVAAAVTLVGGAWSIYDKWDRKRKETPVA